MTTHGETSGKNHLTPAAQSDKVTPSPTEKEETVNINPETAMSISEIKTIMDHSEILLKDLTDDEVAVVTKAIAAAAVMSFAASAAAELKPLADAGREDPRIGLMVKGMIAMLADVAVYGNQMGTEAYEMVTLGTWSDLEG